MDKYSNKVLKFLNKHTEKQYQIIELKNFFPKIPLDDLVEITITLNNEKLTKFTSHGIESTNKGKNYFKVQRDKWISEHFIETLALVLSIIAYIQSTIALIS